jgi:xanthine/uracil permease
MGINNGGISLVVMLVLFVMYIVQTIKHLFGNNNKTVFTAIKFGILAGTVAYMVAGLTTDSVVSVAPVFWIMLGTGFGLNAIKTETSVEAE